MGSDFAHSLNFLEELMASNLCGETIHRGTRLRRVLLSLINTKTLYVEALSGANSSRAKYEHHCHLNSASRVTSSGRCKPL